MRWSRAGFPGHSTAEVHMERFMLSSGFTDQCSSPASRSEVPLFIHERVFYNNQARVACWLLDGSTEEEGGTEKIKNKKEDR